MTLSADGFKAGVAGLRRCCVVFDGDGGRRGDVDNNDDNVER